MSVRYFKKEIPTECWLPDGRKIHCDFIDEGGTGWIATSVGYIVHQIDLAISQQVGGWVNATQQEYEDSLKKKPFRSGSSNPFRANRPFKANQGAVGAGEGSSIEVPLPPRPDPVRVPTADQMKPRKGPILEEMIV